jgi:hypothetical protein
MVSLREVYVPFSHEKRERKLEVKKKKIRKKDLNMREDKGKKLIIVCFVCEGIENSVSCMINL